MVLRKVAVVELYSNQKSESKLPRYSVSVYRDRSDRVRAYRLGLCGQSSGGMLHLCKQDAYFSNYNTPHVSREARKLLFILTVSH